MDDGIWHWADIRDTRFLFDPDAIETSSSTRVSLQTDNWMNRKSNRASLFYKICEMGKTTDFSESPDLCVLFIYVYIYIEREAETAIEYSHVA